MALKKSQLYSSLWQSCDELRGGMDASQYKDYILTLLFMKYVSDKYAGKSDALLQVPPGGGFADMVRLKGDKEIGDKINKIIAKLAEANDLKGVIDEADFNDEDKLGRGKEMQDRLSKLVSIFDGLDFQANRAEGDDLLGDAYEYLMWHFATESGKSKGQFYTPAEVSRILAQVVGIGPDTRQDQTIYDPTCGSGSLLIKAADEAPRGISIYGQENDNATWALARMNMILHGHPTADLWRGNTLASPYFKEPNGSLKRFDFAVANPPFSLKAWTSGFLPEKDEFGRFDDGVPPAKNGDYAFLLHVIASLRSRGKAAVILPHGVLFRGHKEAAIRKNLITRGLIKGIIGLPANLFYGTGIPACIVVIDKEYAQARAGIFMIDASKGFLKDGNKNRLRSQDIHKIVDVFNKQTELPRYSRLVPTSEIAAPANDYNLNIPRYIDSSEPEDLHDLEAHLRGGVPNRDLDALQDYWDVFPSLRKALFRPADREGYSVACVEAPQVKPTILAHPEFNAFQAKVGKIFDQWRTAHSARLHNLKVNDLPRQVIHELSEDLLTRFHAFSEKLKVQSEKRPAGGQSKTSHSQLSILNCYDIYQCLMDYWAEVMQDDVYLIAGDGWVQAAKPRGVIEDKEKKIKETPDLVVKRKKYKMDLIPPPLIVARYFAGNQAEIDALQASQDEATQALEEFIEEHAVEEGLLEAALNDKGKVTKGGVNDRLKQLKVESGDLKAGDGQDEEGAVLLRCLDLMDTEADAKKAVKEAQENLDVAVLKKYSALSKGEIKSLAVDDKWFASIQGAIKAEVDRISQVLTQRVKELSERYETPLPRMIESVTGLGEKVNDHLERLGFTWH